MRRVAKWVAVTVAILVGLFGLAVLGAVVQSWSPAPDPPRFEAAAEQFQAAAPDAVTTCCADGVAATLAPDARPLAVSALARFVTDLGFPATTLTRIETTRALDGVQTAEHDGMVLRWSFHPDRGLTLIAEP